jgi:hypothetical protein
MEALDKYWDRYRALQDDVAIKYTLLLSFNKKILIP